MRRIVAVLLLVALAGGCARKGGTGADPTVPPEPSVAPTSSSTVPADVATVPASIDEEYLNRVLAALDEVDGRATRIIVEKKWVVPEAADLLAAIYDDEEFTAQTEVWFTTIEKDPSLATFRPDPGNRVTRVARVISRSPFCIWMAVTRDYSAIAREGGGPEEELEYIALVLKEDHAARDAHNPTAWVIAWAGLRADGSEPEDKCARR